MSEILTPTNKEVAIPNSEMKEVEIPKKTTRKVKTPTPTKLEKELPSDLNLENCVDIDGNKIEIKPTKVKYFRNKTASIYTILKMVPLNEFLSYEKGTFDSERSSDQILFDFLIAVFDDADIVTRNYDNMTSETIEQILKIFGRINHIEEKEEAARKNREAQMKH